MYIALQCMIRACVLLVNAIAVYASEKIDVIDYGRGERVSCVRVCR